MKILAVGDVFLGDQLACFGFGVRSRFGRSGYSECFECCRRIFDGHDVVFANLESVLGTPGVESPGVRHLLNRGLNEGAAALRAAGVDVVNLANNHIFEHHVEGLEQTMQNLDEAGIAHVGTAASPMHVRSIGHNTVAFLGWSMVPDNFWPETDPSDYYHVTEDITQILEEVASVKSEVDRVVLALHWGHEYVDLPSSHQQAVARELIDAGVDVLVGHHPHTVQPIEEWGGGLIAYSLGNFVFDVWAGGDRHGLALSFEAGALDWSIVPVEIDPTTFGPAAYVEPSTGHQLESHVADARRLSADEASEAAWRSRKRYRGRLVRHGVRNAHRFDLKRQLVGLALRRVLFLVRNIRRERTDPTVVYRGPMK